MRNGSMFIDIWVYSNAEEVELLLPNGMSLGRRAMPRLSHLEWTSVPYMPGTLFATGYVDGKAVSTRELRTSGLAARIELTVAREAGFLILADGRDVAVVIARILNKDGDVVPDASNVVTFTAQGGNILGTANGDPASQVTNTAVARPAFHGLLMVVLQAGNVGGELRVMASSPGLESGRLALPLSTPCRQSDTMVMVV